MINRDTQDFTAFLESELTPANRGRLELLLFYHFGLDRQAEIAALLDLMLNGDILAAARIAATGSDKFHLAALIALAGNAKLQDGAAAIRHHRRIQQVDMAHDFIHANRDDRDWSLIRCLNFLYRRKIRPEKQIAIVAAIRNEGINLIEWIAHHRRLGVDDFFLYVNDNTDGSTDLLNLLAEHGIIHVIWNTTAPPPAGSMFPIQAKCFGHATEFLAETRDYEWLLFLDPDEFLVTRPMREAPQTPRPLDDLFARVAAMPVPPAAVSFNWKFFTSQAKFRREPGLNFERFTQRTGDNHVKTIARGSHCVSFHTSHIPRLLHGDIVLNGALQPAETPYFTMPAVYEYGQINHYFSKSFEEFIGKHLRVWGNRKLPDFFTTAGNSATRPVETTPAAWIALVHQEIRFLKNLPRIEAEIENIEAAYADMLTTFDAAHDIQATYARLAAPPSGKGG